MRVVKVVGGVRLDSSHAVNVPRNSRSHLLPHDVVAVPNKAGGDAVRSLADALPQCVVAVGNLIKTCLTSKQVVGAGVCDVAGLLGELIAVGIVGVGGDGCGATDVGSQQGGCPPCHKGLLR